MTEQEPRRRLILMRHAKSAWNDPALSDHARPLNRRGQRSADALGQWLVERGHLPDQALVSDAKRTQETFAGLHLDIAPDLDSDLYLAEPPRLLSALQAAQGHCVLLIAHNPGIAALAEALLADPVPHPRFIDYPTGATLVADFPIDSWRNLEPHTGRAADFITPRELTD